jgi:hypothetical protein
MVQERPPLGSAAVPSVLIGEPELHTENSGPCLDHIGSHRAMPDLHRDQPLTLDCPVGWAGDGAR